MGRSSDFAPYFGASAVTPADATVLATARALYIGVTGDVAVRTAQGQTVTFKAAPVGVLPVQVDKILSTGTTATNILALY